MALEALYLQAAETDTAVEYSAQVVRRTLLTGLFASPGIIPGATQSAFVISQRAAGANMSVDIAPGEAVILGEDVVDQGTYVVSSTEVENRTVPAAPASGTHVHRAVLRVKDPLHNASFSAYEAVIEVLADDGTGTPATPDSAISLGTVTVAAEQTSVTDDDITNNPPVTALNADPVTASTWQDYTPVLFTGNEAVDLGTNGTATGRFSRVGDVVHFHFQFEIDDDASFHLNENPLEMSLPVDAADVSPGPLTLIQVHSFRPGSDVPNMQHGVGIIEQTGGSRVTRMRFDNSDSDGDLDNAARTIPHLWHGWTIYGTGTYEAA